MPRVLKEYKEKARSEIVKVAQEVFSEKGYHETTMEDISNRIGVSKGALYKYFDSKEQLFIAIVENWQNSLGEFLKYSFTSEQLQENLNNFIDHIQKDDKNNFALGIEIISEAFRNERIKNALQDNYEKNMEDYAEILDKFEDLKKKGKSDIKLRSESFFVILIGMICQMIFEKDEKNIKNIWNFIAEKIFSQ